MEIDLITYGIARDIIGSPKYRLIVKNGIQVGELLKNIRRDFPDLQKLTSLLVAINDEYASNEQIITEGDEVVLIPPVSGG